MLTFGWECICIAVLIYRTENFCAKRDSFYQFNKKLGIEYVCILFLRMQCILINFIDKITVNFVISNSISIFLLILNNKNVIPNYVLRNYE